VEIVYWWSFIGIISYTGFVLRNMKTGRCRVRKRDVFRSIPFGPIAWMSILMAVVISPRSKKRRDDCFIIHPYDNIAY